MAKEKKRKWCAVIAPKLLNSAEVGETYVHDLNFMKDKSFEVNLMSLTNDPRRQNVKVMLRVNDIKDNKAYTDFRGYNISHSYVRRMSKRAKMKFDESFSCVTKDNVQINIKVLMMFKNKLRGKVSSVLRKELNRYVCDFVKNSDFDRLTGIILNQGLQKELKATLSKIYPLSACIIRGFNRL